MKIGKRLIEKKDCHGRGEDRGGWRVKSTSNPYVNMWNYQRMKHVDPELVEPEK